MRVFLILVCIAFFTSLSFSQQKPTSEADYRGTFQYAVSETNAAFPFIFTVSVEEFKNGKIVLSETSVNERQTRGVERETITTVKDGVKSVSYKVSTGFGSVYCSNDGVSWVGPQQYECGGPRRLYGPREIESAEYTVEEKTIDGEKVKVYREYLLYASGNGGKKKDFEETIATITSNGFFLSVESNEGSLDPKIIKLTRKQTWDFKTEFKPVVAPK